MDTCGEWASCVTATHVFSLSILQKTTGELLEWREKMASTLTSGSHPSRSIAVTIHSLYSKKDSNIYYHINYNQSSLLIDVYILSPNLLNYLSRIVIQLT